MIIIPSIDIYQGNVVRLTMGNFNRIKIYSDNPIKQALFWQNQGAQYLHIVDLEGAKVGQVKIFPLLKKIRKEIIINIQFGGGIRSMNTVEEILSLGIDRVVIGSLVLKELKLFIQIIKKYADKLVVAVDYKDRKILTDGWQKKSPREIYPFLKDLQKFGVARIILTDVHKDGTLSSPNFFQLKYFSRLLNIPYLLSGGFSTVKDLIIAKQLGAEGVILGKSLYENKLDFRTIIK